MIDVSRDREGLRQAALEMAAEPLLRAEIKRARELAEGSPNGDRLMAEVQPARSLSAAYYDRVRYLLWLERAMKVARFGPHDLTAAEMDGLEALASARNDFEEQFRKCRCGALNRRDDKKCRTCGQSEVEG